MPCTVETAEIFLRPPDAPAGTLVRGNGYPPGADRFARAGYDVTALLAPGHSWVQAAMRTRPTPSAFPLHTPPPVPATGRLGGTSTEGRGVAAAR